MIDVMPQNDRRAAQTVDAGTRQTWRQRGEIRQALRHRRDPFVEPEQPMPPAKPRLEVFLPLEPCLKAGKRVRVDVATGRTDHQRRRIGERDDQRARGRLTFAVHRREMAARDQATLRPGTPCTISSLMLMSALPGKLYVSAGADCARCSARIRAAA